MRTVSLIGFPDDIAEELMIQLARRGCSSARHRCADDLQEQPAAALICGDRRGWLETICEVRAMYSRLFLLAVTRVPDHAKWLDALDAGASDYCAMPLDDRQIASLRRVPERHRAVTARVTTES